MPRPSAQRMQDNERFRDFRLAAGITQLSIAVPMVRVAELRAMAFAWRQEAKLLLESDRPSADQILQIHSISRTLGKRLPVRAFDTRATAAQWLMEHTPDLGSLHPTLPRLGSAS